MSPPDILVGDPKVSTRRIQTGQPVCLESLRGPATTSPLSPGFHVLGHASHEQFHASSTGGTVVWQFRMPMAR